MKWLEAFEDSNTSFHIYSLHKEEFILLKNKNNYKNIIYILGGYAQLLRVFTNSEKICLQILSNNQIIINHENSGKADNYCDLVLAITRVRIIIMPLLKSGYETPRSVAKLIKTAMQNNNGKDEIVSILSHRNTKKRIIQLLMVLTKRFGQMKNAKIIIPIHLTHQTIADITGSQRITVSRVMSGLRRDKIINYNGKSIIVHDITRLIQA